MKRRKFTSNVILGSTSLFFKSHFVDAKDEGIHNLYDQLKSNRYLGKVKIETTIADTEVFTEGPAVDQEGNVYFTNVRAEKILKWMPGEKRLIEFRIGSNEANGLRFRPDGHLLICEGGIGAITILNPVTGERKILVDRFNDKKIQSPNDLDIDSKGRIYFSSRSNQPDLEKENKRALYRLDPDGQITQLLSEPEIDMPNGVVISPDEKTLYLIEAHSGENFNRCILAFDLHSDGSISNRRTLIDFYPGRSGDGMCIDQEGNLYVAAGLHKTRGSSETLDTRPGIHVISPKGQLLAFRETPVDTITNCTFGGKHLKTLYISCGIYLLSIKTKIPGKSYYRL
ncbi:MAG: SMP-30/gluconolactonase/LRE family protein [Saprospiraceae bacterium]|nr:SMP-30/gluconolactonase/LRE family protein [Saprospiraceae bacterium]